LAEYLFDIRRLTGRKSVRAGLDRRRRIAIIVRLKLVLTDGSKLLCGGFDVFEYNDNGFVVGKVVTK
jgi:hypothetical protein